MTTAKKLKKTTKKKSKRTDWKGMAVDLGSCLGIAVNHVNDYSTREFMIRPALNRFRKAIK